MAMTCSGRFFMLCPKYKICKEDSENVFCDKIQSREFRMIKTFSIIVKKAGKSKNVS
jgi:hypothetical protein